MTRNVKYETNISRSKQLTIIVFLFFFFFRQYCNGVKLAVSDYTYGVKYRITDIGERQICSLLKNKHIGNLFVRNFFFLLLLQNFDFIVTTA